VDDLTDFVSSLKSFRGTPRNVDLAAAEGEVRSVAAGGHDDELSPIEAKYPALLFKQQLNAYVEKIYGMIRDNLKKEISPILGLCIQVKDMIYDLLCVFSYAMCFELWQWFMHFLQAPRTTKVNSVANGGDSVSETLFALKF